MSISSSVYVRSLVNLRWAAVQGRGRRGRRHRRRGRCRGNGHGEDEGEDEDKQRTRCMFLHLHAHRDEGSCGFGLKGGSDLLLQLIYGYKQQATNKGT